MATRPRSNQVQPNALPLLGIAPWFGVLVFGAVVWFVHRGGTFAVRPSQPALSYAQIGVSIAAVVFAFVTRGQLAKMGDGPERNTKILAAWACGEGAALFGG